MLLFPYVQRSSDEGVSISISVCILLSVCVWLWLWGLYVQFAICLLLCWTCRLRISMVIHFKNLLLFLAAGYINCNRKLGKLNFANKKWQKGKP